MNIQILFEQSIAEGTLDKTIEFVLNQNKLLESKLSGLKQAEDLLADSINKLNEEINFNKGHITSWFKNAELDFFETTSYAIKSKKNPPSVVIDNEDLIPSEFKKEVTKVTISKTDLSKALKEREIEGCHLEQSSRVEISEK